MEEIPDEQASFTIPQLLEQLCAKETPDVKERHSSDMRVDTYCIFANLLSVDIFTSVEITSVPEAMLTSADMKMKDRMKEELRRLENRLSSPNLGRGDSTASTGSKTRRREKSEKQEDQSDGSNRM